MEPNMKETQKENACENPDPRIRTLVNACWNCRNKVFTDPAEYKNDTGIPYCILDGCWITRTTVCKDWEEDA